MQWCTGYTKSFHPMPLIAKIRFQKRILWRERECKTHTIMLHGFDFNGESKTMRLDLAKCEKLLTILKGWIQAGLHGTGGVRFSEFESTIPKIRHAFTCFSAGVGLLSQCIQVLKKCPVYTYLHQNPMFLTALKGCRTLLRESAAALTQCHVLTCGCLDYIGIVDASGHGVGGVILGELAKCTHSVFRWEWQDNIKTNTKILQWFGGNDHKLRSWDGQIITPVECNQRGMWRPALKVDYIV